MNAIFAIYSRFRRFCQSFFAEIVFFSQLRSLRRLEPTFEQEADRNRNAA